MKTTQTAVQAHGNACAPTTNCHDIGDTLVLDNNGSYSTKAGIAGYHEPYVEFQPSEPFIVEHWTESRIYPTFDVM